MFKNESIAELESRLESYKASKKAFNNCIKEVKQELKKRKKLKKLRKCAEGFTGLAQDDEITFTSTRWVETGPAHFKGE